MQLTFKNGSAILIPEHRCSPTLGALPAESNLEVELEGIRRAVVTGGC